MDFAANGTDAKMLRSKYAIIAETSHLIIMAVVVRLKALIRTDDLWKKENHPENLRTVRK